MKNYIQYTYENHVCITKICIHRYSISSTAINILVRYLTLKHRDFEHKLGSSVNRSIEAHTFAILCKENNIK